MATEFQRTAFKALLKTARENAGMTQRDLAARVGVSPSAVAQWEAGSSAPREELAAAAEHALGVEPGNFRMVLGYSHRDIRVPGVMTFAEVVEGDPLLTDSQRRLLNVIYEEMVRDTRAALQRAEDRALYGDPDDLDPEEAMEAERRAQEEAEYRALNRPVPVDDPPVPVTADIDPATSLSYDQLPDLTDHS